MIQLEDRPLYACSVAEKETLLIDIAQILRLSKVARDEGLLALEYEAAKISCKFTVRGLLLIVDGTDPGLVKGILETAVFFGEATGAELLRLAIITEGLLSIQAGELFQILKVKLLAFLGEEMACDPITSEKVDALCDTLSANAKGGK